MIKPKIRFLIINLTIISLLLILYSSLIFMFSYYEIISRKTAFSFSFIGSHDLIYLISIVAFFLSVYLVFREKKIFDLFLIGINLTILSFIFIQEIGFASGEDIWKNLIVIPIRIYMLQYIFTIQPPTRYGYFSLIIFGLLIASLAYSLSIKKIDRHIKIAKICLFLILGFDICLSPTPYLLTKRDELLTENLHKVSFDKKLELLDRGSFGVRLWAVQLLSSKYGGDREKIIKALIKTIKNPHESEDIRELALKALGTYRDKRVDEIILENLESKNPSFRRRAIHITARSKSKEVMDEFLKQFNFAVEEKDYLFLQAALGELRDSENKKLIPVPLLLRVLNYEIRSEREENNISTKGLQESAAYILGELNEPSAKDIIISEIKNEANKNSNFRNALIEALLKIDKREALSILIENFDTDDIIVLRWTNYTLKKQFNNEGPDEAKLNSLNIEQLRSFLKEWWEEKISNVSSKFVP